MGRQEREGEKVRTSSLLDDLPANLQVNIINTES